MTASDHPVGAELRGKVCIVTGATAGLGKGIALALARRGAQVILLARDRARGEAALVEIKAYSGSDQLELLLADISSPRSVQDAAAEFKSKHTALRLLVNNAAVYKPTRIVTSDGFELMFATNHLGHFLLTTLLLDELKADVPSTVVNITAPSTTHLNFDDLQGEKSFNALNAFGASKMANLLFTFDLARRVQGTGVAVNAYHPGLVRSTLMNGSPFPMNILMAIINTVAASSPETAAEKLVAAVLAQPNDVTGQFFNGSKPLTADPYAHDERAQARLWTESARLVGLPS